MLKRRWLDAIDACLEVWGNRAAGEITIQHTCALCEVSNFNCGDCIYKYVYQEQCTSFSGRDAYYRVPVPIERVQLQAATACVNRLKELRGKVEIMPWPSAVSTATDLLAEELRSAILASGWEIEDEGLQDEQISLLAFREGLGLRFWVQEGLESQLDRAAPLLGNPEDIPTIAKRLRSATGSAW